MIEIVVNRVAERGISGWEIFRFHDGEENCLSLSFWSYLESHRFLLVMGRILKKISILHHEFLSPIYKMCLSSKCISGELVAPTCIKQVFIFSMRIQWAYTCRLVTEGLCRVCKGQVPSSAQGSKQTNKQNHEETGQAHPEWCRGSIGTRFLLLVAVGNGSVTKALSASLPRTFYLTLMSLAELSLVWWSIKFSCWPFQQETSITNKGVSPMLHSICFCRGGQSNTVGHSKHCRLSMPSILSGLPSAFPEFWINTLLLISWCNMLNAEKIQNFRIETLREKHAMFWVVFLALMSFLEGTANVWHWHPALVCTCVFASTSFQMPPWWGPASLYKLYGEGQRGSEGAKVSLINSRLWCGYHSRWI